MLIAPVDADLRGLHRIELVVNGRSRASEIEDFIDLDIEGETDVVAHQLKQRIREQAMHVAPRAGVEIINTQHFVAALQQPVAKVRSNKSCPAGDEDATFGQHGGVLPQDNGPRAELVFLSFAWALFDIQGQTAAFYHHGW